MNDCVNACVIDWCPIQVGFLPHTQCSQDMLQSFNDQDKAVSVDKMNE